MIVVDNLHTYYDNIHALKGVSGERQLYRLGEPAPEAVRPRGAVGSGIA